MKKTIPFGLACLVMLLTHCDLPEVADEIRLALAADFTITNDGCTAPCTISFSNTSEGTELVFEWNFGDPASGTANTSTLEDPDHEYADPGTYTVRLIVSGGNRSDTTEQTVTILAAEGMVVADFTITNDSCQAPCTVTFTNNSQGESLSYQWDFGDPGSGGSNTSTLENPVHAYGTDGTYTVQLIVSNDTDSDTLTLTVTILPAPNLVTAGFTMSTDTCTAPCTVSFTNTSEGDITAYQWDFGDPASGDDNTSGDMDGTHLYQDPGTYFISLTVTGPENESTFEDTLVVEAPVFTFQRFYGGNNADAAQGLVQLADGSYVVSSYGDAQLYKFDEANGDVLSTYVDPLASNFWIDDLITNPAGELITAGFYDQGEGFQGAITVFSSELVQTGQSVGPSGGGSDDNIPAWYRQVRQRSDGKYNVLAISANSQNTFFGIQFLPVGLPPSFSAKYTEYGSPRLDMHIMADGGILYLARNNISSTWELIKTTPALNAVDWNHSLPVGLSPSRFMVDADGRIWVVGHDGSDRPYLLVLDAQRSTLFSDPISTETGSIHDIRPGPDGGAILAGEIENGPAGGQDALLIKVDTQYRVAWERTFGGALDDGGLFAMATRDGGYIMAGRTKSFGNGNNDIFLVKTNADGQI